MFNTILKNRPSALNQPPHPTNKIKWNKILLKPFSQKALAESPLLCPSGLLKPNSSILIDASACDWCTLVEVVHSARISALRPVSLTQSCVESWSERKEDFISQTYNSSCEGGLVAVCIIEIKIYTIALSAYTYKCMLCILLYGQHTRLR
jgi:hypothetical protein